MVLVLDKTVGAQPLLQQRPADGRRGRHLRAHDLQRRAQLVASGQQGCMVGGLNRRWTGGPRPRGVSKAGAQRRALRRAGHAVQAERRRHRRRPGRRARSARSAHAAGRQVLAGVHALPFDQRRQRAAAQQPAVGAAGDAPAVQALRAGALGRHRLAGVEALRTQCGQRVVQPRAARHDVQQPRALAQPRQQRGIVQAEPARPRRRRRLRVDGDDLQVGHREGRAADGQQPVVRAHRRRACRRPPGTTPSTRSHQAAPCSSVAAATTRWSTSALTASPRPAMHGAPRRRPRPWRRPATRTNTRPARPSAVPCAAT